jgi:hypothetical protein
LATGPSCLSEITGILVHSFIDFNLQIPANAAWFYVLCVLTVSTAPIESHQRVRRVRHKNPEHLAETETPAPGQ